MRYVKERDRDKVRGINDVGNIHTTGSVLGMQERFGWPKCGQVRVGSYIYNVGVKEVKRLREAGLLRGER